MSWKTQYSKPEHFYSNSGTPYEDIYKPEYDKNGHYELKKDGKENIYEKIQSWSDSCDLALLMKKFENGDYSALNKTTPVFLDATDFPTTYMEMFNRLQEAEDNFGQLPTDIKEKFNNNFREYLAQSQEDPALFMDKLGLVQKSSSQESAAVSSVVDNPVVIGDNQVGESLG